METLALPDNHPAMLNRTTRFPSKVKRRRDHPEERILKSWSAKLGSILGWANVERETCPVKCPACSMNKQFNLTRWVRDEEFLRDLRAELVEACRDSDEPRVVRAHVAGDFGADDDPGYALWLGQAVAELPRLILFGMTQSPRESRIGSAVAALNEKLRPRWVFRFSNSDGAYSTTTVWDWAHAGTDDFLCAAQRSGITCDACMVCPRHPERRVAFLFH